MNPFTSRCLLSELWGHNLLNQCASGKREGSKAKDGSTVLILVCLALKKTENIILPVPPFKLYMRICFIFPQEQSVHSSNKPPFSFFLQEIKNDLLQRDHTVMCFMTAHVM